MKSQKGHGLARTLSKMGHCSRSRAVALVRAGQVRLNGKVIRNPEVPVRIPPDAIELNGTPLEKKSFVYLAMNKPRGLVTTASDEKGRETIYSLLDPCGPWVAPVGRLDKASEGLLLLTNDSEWAARVTDPATHLDKVYHVQVESVVNTALFSQITHGCQVDGVMLRAKAASLLRHGEKNSWLQIILDEGKNRQIRRLLGALEISVLRLVRVSIGPLQLGELKKGGVRKLTEQERAALDGVLTKKVPQKDNRRMPKDVG